MLTVGSWQLAVEMIIGIPSSSIGNDLCLPADAPDSTLRLKFCVDLIRICYLQSFDREPLLYSREERFLRLVLEKHEHLIHVRDSNVGFHPVKAA